MKVFLLGATLIVPGIAGAQEVGAQAGFYYRRATVDYPGGPTVNSPEYTLELGAHAASRDVLGDVLRWRLDGTWRRRNSEVNDTPTEKTDILLYSGSLRLFDPRTSPVSLSVRASRTESDTSRGAGNALTSKAWQQTFGGGGEVRLIRQLPVVVDFSRQDAKESIPTLPDHDHSRTYFSANTHQGSGPAQYQATFTQIQNDGNWIADQYDQRRLVYQARGEPGGQLHFDVSGTYEKRAPTTSATGAYATLANGLQAALTGPLEFGQRISATYRYSSVAFSAAPSPAEATIAQGLVFERDVRLPVEHLALHPLVDLAMSEQRLGTTDTRATGETAGVQLWYRTADVWPFTEVHGGPLVSLIQPASGSNRIGHGLTFGAQTVFPWNDIRIDARYDIDYRNDLYGLEGWSLRQNATGGANGRLGSLRYHAYLSAGSTRTWAPLLGDAANRTLTAEGGLGYPSRELMLRVSHQNGLVTGSGFVGDGLLLPTPFDARSTSASLTYTEKLADWLNVYVQGDVNSSRGPGQPSLEQYGAKGGDIIPYGAFTFTAEDQILLSGTPGGWVRNNTVLVRAYRSFGARY